jgi:transposase InsO family protein
LERNFRAESPNEKWATDVTEFKILGQKQYFSPVLDLLNGEVLSYDIRSSPALQLINTMLERANQRLKPGQSPILHFDQGWQYRHHSYQRSLKTKGITQSMSRKGSCLDNAVAENLFGHFKEEFVRPGQFTVHSSQVSITSNLILPNIYTGSTSKESS